MIKHPIRVGLDFDNTIVDYKEAIALLAKEILKLPDEIQRTKISIRNYLREIGKERQWTEFQGILYGPGMKHAKPFEGAIETMKSLRLQGHQLTIISHRSRRPYAGPAYDLHNAAMSWVAEHLHSAGLFIDEDWNPPSGSEVVNFLESFESKIARISELDCNVFVDDLQEVLCNPGFPSSAVGILFSPESRSAGLASSRCVSEWNQLPGMLKRIYETA